MSETPAIPGGKPAIGPGRFILVVGPSGAGKDTLLALAQAACADDPGITFPRRIVTREASSAEDNLQMSFEAFEQARLRGDFAVHWEAHGHCYGLPRAIDDDVRAGRTVVANVSRTVVEAIRCAYAEVTVVAVTAPPEVLAARLATRARASDGKVADRLGRKLDDALSRPDVILSNVGDPRVHARELVRIIKGDWNTA